MSNSFEFYDFVPRKEFKESANKMLAELSLLLPTESICEARCTYFNKVFFFQIKLINNEAEFKSQVILNPLKENTNDRNWQLKAIKKMTQELKSEISNYIRTSQKVG